MNEESLTKFLIDIGNLLPIIVSSLLGAFMKDVFRIAKGVKTNRRWLKMLVSFVFSVFFVGFFLNSFLKGDLLLLCFFGFGFGFAGFNIASYFSAHGMDLFLLIPGIGKTFQEADKARNEKSRSEKKIRDLERELNKMKDEHFEKHKSEVVVDEVF